MAENTTIAEVKPDVDVGAMPFRQRIAELQNEIKCPKSQFNPFANFWYRNAEDILQAATPLTVKYRMLLTVTDRVEFLEGRYHVVATAKLTDWDSDQEIHTEGYAREPEKRPKMDEPQVTGSSSSYARKYALNGLFCLDDEKDSDYPREQKKNGDRPFPDQPQWDQAPPMQYQHQPPQQWNQAPPPPMQYQQQRPPQNQRPSQNQRSPQHQPNQNYNVVSMAGYGDPGMVMATDVELKALFDLAAQKGVGREMVLKAGNVQHESQITMAIYMDLFERIGKMPEQKKPPQSNLNL